MRRLETEIRREKDTVLLAQASGDDVLRRSSQVRVPQLTAKYEQVAKAAGLRTRFEKTRVAGYSPKHAKEAAQYEKYLQFIQNDATMKAKSGLPKKLVDLPDEDLQHTVSVDIEKTEKLLKGFHAVAPKGCKLTSVQVMAGAGTSTPIRDLKRLYMQYNLSPDKWQKKTGTAFGEEFHYVIHWYEHDGVVPTGEMKLKGMKKNK